MVLTDEWRQHFPLSTMEIDLKIRLISLVLEYRRLLRRVVIVGNVIQLYPKGTDETVAIEYSLEKIHNKFYGSGPSITDREYTKLKKTNKEAL